jgi:hypothetical protein
MFMAQATLGENPDETIQRLKKKAQEKAEAEKRRVEDEEKQNRLHRELLAQYTIPGSFKTLDNAECVDRDGTVVWDWTKQHGLQDVGKTAHCFRYALCKAHPEILALETSSAVSSHNGQDSGSDCFGGAWSTGGTITNFQSVHNYLTTYATGDGCINKKYSRMFMTRRAWAVADRMLADRIEIPDHVPGVTGPEKAAYCLKELHAPVNRDVFDVPDNDFRDSGTDTFVTFRYWVTRQYGEEKWQAAYRNARQNALPALQKDTLRDARQYFSYRQYETQMPQQSDIDRGMDYYRQYCRLCKTLGEQPVPVRFSTTSSRHFPASGTRKLKHSRGKLRQRKRRLST